ncbi:DNA-3-methyladenine glycosylase I [Chitinophaga costaii]|uniref:DNA-3-methyladenine glycosylase I n=1 Tax=Chitinophaga costaii TaxID=1335309 RepID=A0A1C3Z7J2_9BACT|nr:DNA-3-methyladenine glycosylase I [Chitinophaga costaii]PUZ30263.1 DNA-3-methyladenine glycosylase I [Chitinophaga costaii]SCB78339.1 DNA-3-methyladenine glycosylase I [Chitinophaga costaii]
MELLRCAWANKDPLYQNYHDQEWGTPSHDDRHLFEMINLEGAQAGLSWYTILVKRENYRQAFDHWDAHKIAQYDADKIASLLQNPGIVRNKLKVNAVVQNAKAFLAIQQEFGNFDQYIWRFVDHQPLIHHRRSMSDVPAKTAVSDAMSKDLLKRGFKFVGSTICYAFMQATGMVNDHICSCWKATPYGKHS